MPLQLTPLQEMRRLTRGEVPAPEPRSVVQGPGRVATRPRGNLNAQQITLAQRRASMTSAARYRLADRAEEQGGFLEQAGVQGLSAFLKILDVINTPQQMAFGAAIGLAEGTSIIQGALDGARNNLTGSDLLEALGVGKLGSVNLPIIGEITGRGVLGLPLDLLIDIPIFGAIGKAARLAKLPQLAKIAGRGIEKGGKSLRKKGLVIPKIAGRRLEAGKPEGIGQELADSLLGQYRTFQSKNERILADLVSEATRLKKGGTGRIKKTADVFGKKITDLAKREGRTVNSITRELADILERKTGVQGLIKGASRLDDFKLRPDGRVFGDHFDAAGKKIAAKVDPKVEKVTQELIDIQRGANVKTIKGKQELFPVANDLAQIKTAKQMLKKERDEAIAASRKLRAKDTRTGISVDRATPGLQKTTDTLWDVAIKDAHGDELFDLAMEAKNLFHDGLIQEINHGVGTLALDDTWLDYITHYLLPAAKTKLLSARTAGAIEFTNASRLRVHNPTHSFQLLRKWDGMTVNELNDLGRAKLLPGFEGIHFDQLFTTDISTVLAARLTRGLKARTDADIFTNAARQLGTHVDDIPKGELDNFRKLAITANQDERLKPLGLYMNNYYFEKDVARHLDSYFSTMQNPRGMHPFLEKFDRIQGIWKASTLFMFPAYHSRNFIGNLWNNNLADATMWLPNRHGPVGYYSLSADFLPARLPGQATKKGIQSLTLHGQKYSRAQMDDLLERHGIMNQFREFLAIPEVKIGVKELPGGPFLGKIPGVGKATEAGIEIGSWIENHARAAHFFSVLDKTGDAKRAAFSVKKHLFNYDELTDFEQASMRRIMPFFAWTRNNLPLQVRNIVSQPQKFSQLKDIIDFVEGEKTPPRGEDVIIHKWMKRNSPILTRVDEKGNPEYFLLGGWLPAADVGKIAEPWKILLDELSPFIKEPIEQLINFDTFLQREITEFPGQKRKFLGLNIRPSYIGWMRNIRLLSLIDSIGASVEGAIRTDPVTGKRKTGIFSDATAKPINDMILAQTLGINMRSVDRRAARAGLLAQMNDLKKILRREIRNERLANAETVRDELIDLAKRSGVQQ